MPGQCAADHGQEVDQGDPQRPQQRERDPEQGERDEDDGPGDQRGQQVAQRVAGRRLADLAGHPRAVRRSLWRHQPEQSLAHLGALELEEHGQGEDGPERGQQ